MSLHNLPLQGVFTALIVFSAIAGAILTPLIIASGMARSNGDSGRAQSIPVALAVVFAGWFAVIAAIAYNGGFSGRPGQPPTVMALSLALPLIAGAAAIWLIPTLRRTLANPAIQPGLIAVQGYRAIDGAVFLALIPLGQLPALFAIPAGIGDLLVGLTAVAAANALRRGKRSAAVQWNALGLLDLVVAIALGILTVPGKTQLFVTNPTSLAITLAPIVLIPAFYVPFSIWLHIVSTRFLLGRAQAEGAPAAQRAELARPPVTARS